MIGLTSDNNGSAQLQKQSDTLEFSSQPAAENAARLSQLWRQRTEINSSAEEYPIGPGDVLTVSVSDVVELQQKRVRVSDHGMIELPLIGTMEAGGLTEENLAKELDNKLESLMYKPQASVFVEQYYNRKVAVVGEVNRPGLVVLERPSETVLDVLTQSGGVSSAAADEVIVIPARADRPVHLPGIDRTSLLAPSDAVSDDHAPTLEYENPHNSESDQSVESSRLSTGQYIVPNISLQKPSLQAVRISFRSNFPSANGPYLNLPVRPGDVLVVPGGGEAMVVGWVRTPGHFGVGSGLTVLGAIGAAGGAMFAANTAAVVLIRSGQSGSKKMTLNLDRISRGQTPDVPVVANDVIDVPYSGWKIGPYIFYSILTRVGIGGPTIPY